MPAAKKKGPFDAAYRSFEIRRPKVDRFLIVDGDRFVAIPKRLNNGVTEWTYDREDAFRFGPDEANNVFGDLNRNSVILHALRIDID